MNAPSSQWRSRAIVESLLAFRPKRAQHRSNCKERRRHVPTDSARSPNCNPHAERFVKTVRTGCLDHFVNFRRASPPAPAQGVCGALPDRAPSPRARQPNHQAEGIAEQRQSEPRRDRMPVRLGTKRLSLSAPNVEEAIRALVAGDVETARRLLQ
jgi:hypothetical protein